MALGASGFWATKDVHSLMDETHEEGHTLRRSVGPVGLTAMGVGAIIGTGIFVVIGEGAAIAGPAVILSFVLAAVACIFSALSYAELASSIPVSGSAYTYAYATLGELVAWIIGWDLILEYGVSVAAVAVGWGGNFNAFLDAAFGFELPDAIATAARGRRRLQPAGRVHRAGDHVAAGPRHPGERPGQPGHGRRSSWSCWSSSSSSRSPSFSTEQLRRRSTPTGVDRDHRGGGHHLLRLHRVRRGLDRQRGGARTRARPADRDHRLAGDLHGLLRADGDRRDRLSPAPDQLEGSDAPLADRARGGRRDQLGGARCWRSARWSRSPAWSWSSCTARPASSSPCAATA